MKIAVVSESSPDEAAVKILVDAVLGVDTVLVASRRPRPRGWPSVLTLLPTIIKDLHYNSDADGLVVVADSDDSPCHDVSHEGIDTRNFDCRLCQLRRAVTTELQSLSAVPGRETLKVAIGLAVPAIEAWYLCGVDTHVNEATWTRKLLGEHITYDKISLKKASYGSDRVPSGVKAAKAREAAERLIIELAQLEQLFPNGFRPLAQDLRDW